VPAHVFVPQEGPEFCEGAESVRCADVIGQTGGDFCGAEYICNYRYQELDQIIDFCAWEPVCACSALGCAPDERKLWRYTIERPPYSADLYVKISFIDAVTGAVGFDSVGFWLQNAGVPPHGGPP